MNGGDGDGGGQGEPGGAAVPPPPLEWKFSQVFGERAAGEEVQEAIEFDKTGDHLATGDRGGRVVLFERTDTKDHGTNRRELEKMDSPVNRHPEFRYKTEFQSHEPEFDYLKSLEIEEKINKSRWCQTTNSAVFLLSINDKTIKFWKSLRLRGIRFPVRDTESVAPNFTPASAISEPVTNPAFQGRASPVVPTFSAEQIKEVFNVARNSIEVLSIVLSSSPHQDVLKDDLTTALAQQCRSSRSTIQRIIATSGENEALLKTKAVMCCK